MARNPVPFLGSNYPADEGQVDEDNKLESKGLRGSNKVYTEFSPSIGTLPMDKYGRKITGDKGYKQQTIEPVEGYIPDMDFSKSK